jgi:hypothetical protein
MRVFLSAILATTLIASSALAETGALAPGKPAGVKQAQMTENEMFIALGVAAVAAGIVAAATSQNHVAAAAATTTTTTTTTSP